MSDSLAIQGRNVLAEMERDTTVCSWCRERLPEGEDGTCDERCSVLFQAERDGRNTCCQICEEDFTVSQVQRNASTCTPRCRKRKHAMGRNA